MEDSDLVDSEPILPERECSEHKSLKPVSCGRPKKIDR